MNIVRYPERKLNAISLLVSLPGSQWLRQTMPLNSVPLYIHVRRESAECSCSLISRDAVGLLQYDGPISYLLLYPTQSANLPHLPLKIRLHYDPVFRE
jgi:hypothetical protein